MARSGWRGYWLSAIRYALVRCRALTRYVDDGLLKIDNSSAEKALCAVSIEQKNYLLSAPTPAASAQRGSTLSSAQPSSADSVPHFTSVLCRLRSPIIRSTASANSCTGTWLSSYNHSPQKPPKRRIDVHLLVAVEKLAPFGQEILILQDSTVRRDRKPDLLSTCPFSGGIDARNRTRRLRFCVVAAIRNCSRTCFNLRARST